VFLSGFGVRPHFKQVSGAPSSSMHGIRRKSQGLLAADQEAYSGDSPRSRFRLV